HASVALRGRRPRPAADRGPRPRRRAAAHPPRRARRGRRAGRRALRVHGAGRGDRLGPAGPGRRTTAAADRRQRRRRSLVARGHWRARRSLTPSGTAPHRNASCGVGARDAEHLHRRMSLEDHELTRRRLIALGLATAAGARSLAGGAAPALAAAGSPRSASVVVRLPYARRVGPVALPGGPELAGLRRPAQAPP